MSTLILVTVVNVISVNMCKLQEPLRVCFVDSSKLFLLCLVLIQQLSRSFLFSCFFVIMLNHSRDVMLF